MGGESETLVGATIDERWHILHQLDAGAVGVIYVAERVGLGRQVALKILNRDFSSSNEFVRRFAREVRAMSRLQHVNCVSILDVGAYQDRPYLVMELLAGAPLSEEIKAGTIPVRRAVGLMRQVLLGVGHAHGHNIVHRDLKPANIIVTELEGVGEVVKILDFGFVHIADSRISQSNAEIVPGTPSYMSPEQARGIKTDPRSDLYAVGVMLYELCVGFRPFFGKDAFEVLEKHMNEPPVPPRVSAPVRNISEALEAVILRALAKDPNQRFADAAEFVAALDATPEGRSAPSRRMRVLRWGLIAAAAIALVAVLVAVTTR
jgi:serine/threonine-protein kinase